MVCKRCGKVIPPIIINTTLLTLAEYMDDMERRDGLCRECYNEIQRPVPSKVEGKVEAEGKEEKEGK